MHRLRGTRGLSRFGIGGLAVAIALVAAASLLAVPASAQLFWPRYYAPPPYYYPPPAYYPPPPGPITAPEPMPAAPAAAAPASMPAITYTKRKAFRNANGETCREYKSDVGGNIRYGTACRDAAGQWRVAN